MSHATTELLSAYLDRELTVAEERSLESHLESCEVCRGQIEGMRRVIKALHQLPLHDLAPPPTLDHAVARRIVLEKERTGLLERLEQGFSGFERQSSLLVLFAVVMALAVLMVMFSAALHRARNSSSIEVIFTDSVSTGAVPGSRLEIADRSLVRGQHHWIEEGVGIEEGVEPTGTLRVIEIQSPAGTALLTAHPSLAALARLDAPAIVLIEGEIVELRPPSQPPDTVRDP